MTKIRIRITSRTITMMISKLIIIKMKKSHIIFSFFYIIRIKRKDQHPSQSNTQIFTSKLYSKLEEKNNNENGVIRWSN